MPEDAALAVAVFCDRCRIEEIEGFGGSAPGAAAGTGYIGKNEIGAGCAGGRGLSSQVGEEGGIALDAGGGESRAEVLQDGGADVGGGDMKVGIEVMGEDGLAAAGGAGIPEEIGVFAELQVRADLLGTIVLDDDLVIGGEVVFDLESVWEANGRWGDEFVDDLVKFLKNGGFMVRADADEQIGLTEEGEAECFVVNVFREPGFPGEDVGEIELGAGGLGLEVGDLFCDREGDVGVPGRLEMFKDLGGLLPAEEKAGEEAIGDGGVGEAVAEAVEAVD